MDYAFKTIFFIHGAKRSGKGTLASILENEYPGTRSFKFADCLKELCFLLLLEAGYSDKESIGNLIEEDDKELPLACFDGLSMRTVMQYLGTKFRQFNPLLWIELTTASLRHHIVHHDGNIILDDGRFFEEYNALKSFTEGFSDWRFVPLKIVRPNFKNPCQSSFKIAPPKRVVIQNGILCEDVAAKLVEHLMGRLHALFDTEGVLKILCGETVKTLRTRLIELFTDAQELQNSIKAGQQTHISEKGLPDEFFHHILINNSSKDTLAHNVQRFLLRCV